MWLSAEPVVREWIERKLGPAGKLEYATENLGQFLAGLPRVLEDVKRSAALFAGTAGSSGVRLDPESIRYMVELQGEPKRWMVFWLAVGAISLALIATRQLL
jgi:ubiquinone biosynthesis protein